MMNSLPAVQDPDPDPNQEPPPEDQVAYQIQALRGLQAEIPLNDFGLPTGIYRTDLLPFHDYLPDSRPTAPAMEPLADGEVVFDEMTEYRIAGFPSAALSKAFIPLQYDEGFPAFDNGSPFWGCLDFEPAEAFNAFQRYLGMNVGTHADRENDDDHGSAASGTRSVSDLAAILHTDSNLLQMARTYQGYYHLYYWGSRSHAYDLFRVAQYRKMQELRAVETQDEHYIDARRLKARLMRYFESDEDFWDMMTPKVGIDFLKTLTGMERVSAGIPAAGPQSLEQVASAGKPFEVHLRTIAQTNRGVRDGVSIDEDGEVLDKALADPETTRLLQEIIIRSGG